MINKGPRPFLFESDAKAMNFERVSQPIWIVFLNTFHFWFRNDREKNRGIEKALSAINSGRVPSNTSSVLQTEFFSQRKRDEDKKNNEAIKLQQNVTLDLF